MYLVASPIGNLSDISYRAVQALDSSDYILCEDTRRSSILLKHYNISKPLKSYHKFKELSSEKKIIGDLKDNKILSLLSDAGTPGIADPGHRLIQKCIKEEIRVSCIPGPCAAIAALIVSGLCTERFQFVGFLPKKKTKLSETLKNLLFYEGTTICYESPKRLVSTLKILQELEPNRNLVVARELTKKYEEILRGKAKELLGALSAREIKGEIALLIAANEEEHTAWEKLSAEEHVSMLEKQYKISRKEAIKIAANLRNTPKRTVYNEIIESDNSK